MDIGSQIPLKFEYHPSHASDDFLIASNNLNAIRWIDSWPEWPTPVICIFGPSGCGKTHLAEVFRVRSKAIGIDVEWLNSEYSFSGGFEFILDDIPKKLTKLSEISLFHLYNDLKEMNGHLLITANTPPAKWKIELADLRSRLKTSVAVEIGLPDDSLMAAVLLKMFSDRQLTVTNDVISFAINHMERSFSMARALVNQADQIGLVKKRRITVPLVKQVLKLLESKGGDKWI